MPLGDWTTPTVPPVLVHEIGATNTLPCRSAVESNRNVRTAAVSVCVRVRRFALPTDSAASEPPVLDQLPSRLAANVLDWPAVTANVPNVEGSAPVMDF